MPGPNEKDYYAVLGVERDADVSNIKKAYRKLQMENHPDKNPAPEAAVKLREVNEAYAVLSDPHLREAYNIGGVDGAKSVQEEVSQSNSDEAEREAEVGRQTREEQRQSPPRREQPSQNTRDSSTRARAGTSFFEAPEPAPQAFREEPRAAADSQHSLSQEQELFIRHLQALIALIMLAQLMELQELQVMCCVAVVNLFENSSAHVFGVEGHYGFSDEGPEEEQIFRPFAMGY